MKKLIALLLALVMVFALAACGSSEAPAAEAPAAEAPAAEAPAAEAPAAEASAEAAAEVTDANPVVNLNGTFDKSLIKDGVLLTSVGQSADTSMMEALLKKVGVEYTVNNTATADDLAGFGTVIVVAGASTKGLGAAGISTEDEIARAEALLKACKDSGLAVIMAHIGGESRRGSLSDQFTQLVMENADYMIVVAEGDKDAFFSSYASANSVPLTLVKSLSNVVTPLSEIFG